MSNQKTKTEPNREIAPGAEQPSEAELNAVQLRRLNRTYAVLSAVNLAIVRLRQPQALFEEACRIAVETGGFCTAWIGLLDPLTSQVQPAAHAGKINGYLEQLHIVVDDSPYGRGPTARAIRERQPVTVNDLESEPAMGPWRAAAQQLGFRASVALPLLVNDQPLGALNLYAAELDFFDEAELKLLTEMAADIALGWEYALQEQKRQQAEALAAEQSKFIAALADTFPAIIYVYDLET